MGCQAVLMTGVVSLSRVFYLLHSMDAMRGENCAMTLTGEVFRRHSPYEGL
jgi:hypothetical protein